LIFNNISFLQVKDHYQRNTFDTIFFAFSNIVRTFENLK
jgi:hypothetical protein